MIYGLACPIIFDVFKSNYLRFMCGLFLMKFFTASMTTVASYVIKVFFDQMFFITITITLLYFNDLEVENLSRIY